jgi:carbon-monoxide dehydrogenase iron sulfur subunit
MAVCPTAAIGRSPDDENVLIDDRKCISCAMCALVCPFDVITYYESAEALQGRTVALKCDHCQDRQTRGLDPACVEVCKVNALQFGDINRLTREASSRLARAVSIAAASVPPEPTRQPEHVEAWRGWGKDISKVNERKE